MSMPSGGGSATFGFGFQSLWIARLFLDVIRDAAVSVFVEPPETSVRKAECIVTRRGGTEEAHQCKRQNGSKGIWSAADLEAEGILTAAKAYLDESPTHEFHFVSGDKASGVNTLAERARVFEQIDDFKLEAATNSTTRKDWKSLIKLFQLDPSSDRDLITLRDFLRRFHVHIEDIEWQRENVEELASRWVKGDPKHIVQTLEKLADTTVRRQLGAVELKVALETAGFALRDLTKDLSLPLKILNHCDRYAESFKPYLIGGRIIGRPEAKSVLNALGDTDTRVILVHGPGGCGKSGALYEVLEAARVRGDICLAIRLDQDSVGNSANDFATNLELPAAPAACLIAAAGGRNALLLIDQLDAVRWTTQHCPRAIEIVTAVVTGALGASNVKVVIACRTFDVKDNAEIDKMFSRLEDKEKGLRKIECGPLSENARDELLQERLQVNPSNLTSKELKTLTTLQNIWLLAKLLKEVGPTSFVSPADLNRKYWDWVRRQLSDSDRMTFDERLLPELTDSTIPGDLRSRFGSLLDRLQSLGVLVQVGSKAIRFAHQTHYDYLAAERLSARLRKDHEDLTAWLLSHDELFHRNQLRQLLEMLRDDDLPLFLGEVRKIVTHAQVRFHLKHTSMQVLAANPSPVRGELRLFLEFEKEAALRPHVLQMIYGSPGWFDVLVADGVMLEWVLANDEKLGAAKWLLRSVVEERGDLIVSLLQNVASEKLNEIVDTVVLVQNPEKLCDKLFSAYLRVLRHTPKAIICGPREIEEIPAKTSDRTVHREISSNFEVDNSAGTSGPRP